MRKSIKENENWQTKAPEVCCKKDGGGREGRNIELRFGKSSSFHNKILYSNGYSCVGRIT